MFNMWYIKSDYFIFYVCLSKELGEIEFPLIVKSLQATINTSNESDKKFIEILNNIVKKILKDFCFNTFTISITLGAIK